MFSYPQDGESEAGSPLFSEAQASPGGGTPTGSSEVAPEVVVSTAAALTAAMAAAASASPTSRFDVHSGELLVVLGGVGLCPQDGVVL